jgi:Flp pilus assembly protein TadG
MSRGYRHALRDEQGQVFVFAVLAAGLLIAVVVLFLDAGSWFQAKRRAQSVADAAALAAVPQLLDDPSGVQATVDDVAQRNWPGVPVPLPVLLTPAVNPRQITVTATPPDNGPLSLFGHVVTPTISASATATIQAPARLNAIAPVVVVCSSWCHNTPLTWNANPWNNGVPVPFTYVSGGSRGDPGTFSLIQLPDVSTGNFDTYLKCDAMDPGSSECNDTAATAPGEWPPLPCLRLRTGGCRDANQVANALSRAANDPVQPIVHLIPIADGYSGGRYNVVGWGAGTFTSVSRSGQTVQLSVSFQKLLVDGKWAEPGAAPNQYDFGVRAIALTG